MHDDLVQVRTGELRGAADRLVGTGYRLGHGPAGGAAGAALLVPAPGWAAASALSGLESAVHEWFAEIGGRTAQTADGLRAAADGYDAADDRAATRLSAGR
ncbi:excreted virulence factor EspC (type VII ESX diderm) [Micromonospora pisi]|uniref:Excreted virulence factor EspC (Type VII ESX diderm) n=1 Tax=Micromonospora pisi TaxID=589240 RepID=A0A495JM97_9ACTN|nr:type VII secretion target [Micromonospora pisi]RKR90136.1 excreted virulence factor EspC (type VII ESX diderm) [Micromonospora pisi]